MNKYTDSCHSYDAKEQRVKPLDRTDVEHDYVCALMFNVVTHFRWLQKCSKGR